MQHPLPNVWNAPKLPSITVDKPMRCRKNDTSESHSGFQSLHRTLLFLVSVKSHHQLALRTKSLSFAVTFTIRHIVTVVVAVIKPSRTVKQYSQLRNNHFVSTPHWETRKPPQTRQNGNGVHASITCFGEQLVLGKAELVHIQGQSASCVRLACLRLNHNQRQIFYAVRV